MFNQFYSIFHASWDILLWRRKFGLFWMIYYENSPQKEILYILSNSAYQPLHMSQVLSFSDNGPILALLQPWARLKRLQIENGTSFPYGDFRGF